MEADDKVAKNISISKSIRDMGERLAAQDHRDFSNEVEWLIEREYTQRNGVKEGAAA